MSKAGMIVTALIVAVVGIAAFAIHSYAADDPTMPQAGEMAPTFTLPSQDGTQISLDSFKGKWVVLYFYPKDMTTGCTIEAHNFQRDLAQYEQMNAVILGVSADTVDSHKEFCTKDGLTFKLLADPSHKVTTDYGSLAPSGTMALRNTFLIDPQGVIVKVYEKVNPMTHSEQLLADLADLQKSASK